MNIGVIGNGYVGGAVARGFIALGHAVKVHDVKPEICTHDIDEVVNCDFVFICVPTPSVESGFDISYVRRALESIEAHRENDDSVCVMKSTVMPGTTRLLSNVFGFPIVFNPEFLTQRTADYDFLNPSSIVFGCDDYEVCDRIDALYLEHFDSSIVQKFDTHEVPELIKCARNSFSAVKVSFFNEIYSMCQKAGIDYGNVLNGILASGWVNPMHTTVPGPDGKLGYGGACLPKDIGALVAFGKQIDIETPVMSAAIDGNSKRRL